MSGLQGIRHDDERFMAAAVRLARRHIGQTKENPSVGALIVRNDGYGPYIAGSGVTAPGGGPHAEMEALATAGGLARGATAYVTLEPCAHYGRTPPCAEALLAAGIVRVVIGAGDPDMRVCGKGVLRLRRAGVEVVEHVLADKAVEGLSAYLLHKKRGRPEVTLKLAVSADGAIGRKGESNFPVSGPVSRAQSHLMRAESDAILVGIGTAVVDNPMLDCRLPGLEACQPVRIVVDSRLRLSPDSRLVRTAGRQPLWIVCGAAADAGRAAALKSVGCRVLPNRMRGGKLELHSLLGQLGEAGICSVLVEGGARIAASFWDDALVDRLVLFQSPLLVGSGGCKAPDFSGRMQEYRKIRCEQFGEDRCTQWKRVA